MTAKNYPDCLKLTLEYEGGYSNDAGDPGGPTKYGITIHDVRQYLNPSATAADVKALTIEQAKTIYRQHYWNPVEGDAWPEGLDLSVWDAGVNSGTGRAKTWAQSTLDSSLTTFLGLASVGRNLRDKVPAIKKYNARRLSFLHGLRTWSIFGKGWGRRVAGIEAKSVSMALMATNLLPAEVNKRLKDESNDAGTKSKTNAGGAAGTGVAGGAGTAVDWANTELWLIVLIGIIGLCAAVYFIRWAIIHKQRSDAYREAAKLV